MANNIKIVGDILTTTLVSRYTDGDKNLLSPKEQQENFGGNNDYIEYYIYDISGNLLNTEYDYLNYKLPSSTGLTPGTLTQPNTTGNIQTTDVGVDSTLSTPTSSLYPIIEIDPITDLQNYGYTSGEFKVRYNFFQNKISDVIDSALFIKEISQDRTELRLASLILPNEEIERLAISLIDEMNNSTEYYVDYLLNFGSNVQVVAINIALNRVPEGYEILFKLYQPLPLDIIDKTQLWVVDEKVDPYEFEINLDKLVIPAPPPQLKGPNFDIEISNINSGTTGTIGTPYTNYTTLISRLETLQNSSYQQILGLLASQSADINIDYSEYDNFSFFGSVNQRLANFYDKVKQIENYKNQINVYTPLTASSPNLITEINQYKSSINTTISQFDGYENYLYFESGSYSWPKSGSLKPFELLSTGSAVVINWYNNTSLSASIYDRNNPNNLIYAIPSYLIDDGNNQPFTTFLNMVGHYFDNIWIYLKAITDINVANNNLEAGVSRDLVYYQLQSLGLKLYNSQAGESVDQFLIGANTGSSAWDNNTTVTGSYLNNVPRKDLVSELYKRIYHNLPLLLKQKGTVEGLDNLMTIFGIPNREYYTVGTESFYTPTGNSVTASILNVKEYGGGLKSNLISGYNNDKVRIVSNAVTESVLSSILSLQTYPTASSEFRENDMHYVDISFSPQNQIDTYISGAISSNNPTWSLDDYIGDPGYLYSSSYSDLDAQRKLYFETGVPGYAPFTSSLLDYNGFIRLVEYFDNALFKMLADFVPERASLSTGVTINSPVLERNKVAYANPINSTTQSVPTAEYSSSTISPVYGTFYNYLGGNKAAWYDGNITGSTVDINQYFTDNNNPYLLGNTASYNAGRSIDQQVNYNTFLHSDWNVLQNNVSQNALSKYRFSDIQGISRAVVSASKEGEYIVYTYEQVYYPAELQDSYLSLTSYNNSRYAGTKLTSRYYNNYTSASYINGLVTQSGDISYGKTAVIDQYVRKIGLFTSLDSDLFFDKKTEGNLKYLVDEKGNLTELNQKNKHWEEVQNTFKAGTNQAISLFDNQKFSNQKRSDGNKILFNSGYSYTPLFYFSNTDRTASFQYSGTSQANMFKYETVGGTLGSASAVPTPTYIRVEEDPGLQYLQNIFGAPDIEIYNDNLVYTPGFIYGGSVGYFGYYDVKENGYYGFAINNLNFRINVTKTANVPVYSLNMSSSYGNEPNKFSSEYGGFNVSTLNGTVDSRFYTSGSKIYLGIQRFYDAVAFPTYERATDTVSAGGILQSTLSGGVPFALSPFTSSISTTQFCLDEQFALFYGYLFLPQGSGTYPSSSLYPTYGDVDYDFTVSPGDYIKFVLYDISYEFEIASTVVTQGTAGTGSLCFNINGVMPNALIGSFSAVNQVLILKKVKDETNVIFSYIKPTGQTSYGFLIPENLSPEVLANIDTITKEVKQKLLADQQGTTT
jgi:hypothetical protein